MQTRYPGLSRHAKAMGDTRTTMSLHNNAALPLENTKLHARIPMAMAGMVGI